MSFPAVMVASVVVACSAVGPLVVYKPPKAVPIDAIEQALTKDVNSPNLTKTQLDSANEVAVDVERTVMELDSPKPFGKLLSKEAKAEKATVSIKELQALQTQGQKAVGRAVYNPPQAGTAIDAIEQALTKVVNSPNLTKTQLDSAKKVIADVEKTVAELESPKGKLLSKEAQAEKVAASIKELQALQIEWQKAAEKTIASRKEVLTKELQQNEAEKEELQRRWQKEQKELQQKGAELDKDKKMLLVMNLEKKLAEKKLALQKLVPTKTEAATQQASQKKAAAQQEMVNWLVNAADSLQASKGAVGSQPNVVKQGTATEAATLKGVQTYLEGRMHNVSDAIAELDADEKKQTAKLKTAAADVPNNGQTDAINEGRSLLNAFLKKEHRKYQKAEAGLKSELGELQGAVTSIKNGDGAGLSKVMNRMQGEIKAEAKAHKFLY